KRDVYILSGLILVVLCITFWPNSGKQPEHYFPNVGLPIAMVAALLTGLLICIHKLIQTAETSLQNLKHANDEYQEEIEERKWTEAMLQESWIYSESIVETIAEPLLVLDQQLRVIKANQSFYQTFQISPEETINRSLTEVDRGRWDQQEIISRLEKCINEGQQIKQFELTQHFDRIGERTILLNAKRIYGKESTANLILVTMQDVTQQRRAKQELAQRAEELARSNAELEQFAYIASHDLQEPLRMISSYCQLLQRRYRDKLDKDANEFIDFAVNGAKQMQTLINDLLTYSRAGTHSKPPKPVDCNEVLEKVRNNLRVALKESHAVLKHDPLPVTCVDDSQIMQVFQNLIANAIKFKAEPSPVITIAAESKGSEWQFSFKDNGIGIDPSFLDRIFVIFQRLHTRSEYPGTGIGLALCKKIVERHGGRIWVESEPDAGSTFYFTLPKAEVVKI
ncbi:ATP-binding protein, partial [bacterium]|nr:ATP-binding protein [bacterium]